MKSEYIDIPLVKNEDKKRFEIELDSHFAFIDYNTLGNQMQVNTKRKNNLDLSHLPNSTYIVVLKYLKERVSKIIYKE